MANYICAGCHSPLNVPSSVDRFTCNKCHMPQDRVAASGIKKHKIQLPCANCRVILNVPPGVHFFQCPSCKAELAVDPSKLRAYIRNLSLLQSEHAEQTPTEDPAEGARRKIIAYGKLLDLSSDGLVRMLTTGNTVRAPDPFLEEINEVVREVELEEDDDGAAGETFTEYRPSKVMIGVPHPDPVVETSSLGAVQPPDPTYELLIGPEMESSGALSCLQLETVTYACQRHEYFLPDGSRAGFFIGDGAGVGKGRTVAGLISENWRKGRKKSLWVSISPDLKFDARRDLDDAGAKEVDVHALNKLPYGKLDSKALGVREGVIFLTYASLIAASDARKSRLQQLVQWAGPSFDGLLVFDECHKAKNLIPEAGGNPTRTGAAVLELQAKLPLARVVYCSATGASEPRNMGYMVRLGLWGPGIDFPNFKSFLDALEKRGVGALELIAMDMKARGMYVSRTLSFKGAEFKVDEIPLNAEMNEMYSTSAMLWMELRKELLKAAESAQSPSDVGKKTSNSLWRYFWATHQRFFRHLCMAAKVPAVVKLATDALAEGKCVVIGLQSTGEARTEDAVSKYGLELEDFVSGPRELLLKLVEDHYPLPEEPGLDPVEEETEKNKREEEAAKMAKAIKKRKRPIDRQLAATVSLRGRLRKAVRYKGFDDDRDDDDYIVEAESSSDDSDDLEAGSCHVCRNDELEGSLALCKFCNEATHRECIVPAQDGKSFNYGACKPCGSTRTDIMEEIKKYFMEKRRKYESAKAIKDSLLAIIRKLKLPNNPLDELLDQLGGPEKVAEMTGRRGMLIRAANGKGVTYQARSSKDVPQEMANMNEKQLFLNDKKQVAIISEAASAGISLQADRRVKNQRRRVHITLELPWSADKAIQQFGRTHRSNQASAPQYRLMFTNLGGERRFASIVAKRLETLGALTQGDRRAGPSLSAYNFDSLWGKKALPIMYKAIMQQGIPRILPPGCSADDLEAQKAFYAKARAVLQGVGIVRDNNRIGEGDMTDVGRFLNRALGMEPVWQNNLFEMFVTQFEALVREARQEGHFDAGIVDIRAASIGLIQDSKPVHVDPMSKAPTTYSIVEINRGISWEAALEIHDKLRDGGGNEGVELFQGQFGFYLSRREWLGRRHCILAIEKPGSNPKVMRILRPGSGEATREMALLDMDSKYIKADLETAHKSWAAEFDFSAEWCMHGPKCKVGSECTVGRRIQEVHILGGLVFSVWATLEQALSKQVRLSHRKLRVVRLETTTSEHRRIVGVHVPNPAVKAMLEGFEKLKAAEEEAAKLAAQKKLSTARAEVEEFAKPSIPMDMLDRKT